MREKKKIRKEKEDEQSGRKGGGKSAGLDGEALLQRQGKVSNVVPLHRMGMQGKRKRKGRRNVNGGGKTGDGER